MYERRYLVTLFSIILFLTMIPFARDLPNVLKENGFTPVGSESDQGYQQMEHTLGIESSSLTVVYKSNQLDLTEPKQVKRILSSLSSVEELPYVTHIHINELGKSKKKSHIQSVHISLSLTDSESINVFPKIRDLIPTPDGMEVYVNGGIATLYDIQTATKNDLLKAEMIGLPIALLVLLVIFGTVVASFLPIIVGLMGVTITLGITYFVADYYSLSNFLPNIVTMIGLAIGIDYALFVVSRFREELELQSSVKEAVGMTSQMAGTSIIFSGFAVLIGLFGMLFIDLPIMRALCLGGIFIVLFSVLLSNTLLLSLLAIIGKNINRFKVFPTLQARWSQSTFWEKVAFAVMKRPVFLALFMSGLLILLMVPIGGIKLGVPTADVLPPTYESRIGADLIKEAYDDRERSPIYLVVEAEKPITNVSTIKKLNDYSKEITKVAGVKEVRSFITALGNHPPDRTAELLAQRENLELVQEKNLLKQNTALITVIGASHPESIKTEQLVVRLRQLENESFQTYITGPSAYRVDMLERIKAGLPYLITFVMIVTYIILFIAFRSALLPLKAVLMNVLSLGASLGIVVIVFQKGLFADLFQVTSTGYVSIVMPVTIFCVVFGISMDYEVFLISRILEEYERTGDNDYSTATGLRKTGGLISSAALILMVVVGSFIFTDIEITKALGIGLFSAIFIDATFIRIIVVPALMKLMGHANWWAPKFLFKVR
ncbi:MMPL family transporter [Bacillus sp. 31A1R]|uniref:MMPL family transporter n=1 Tax=Robertmurraya mangrovi TaxID=3098077 RepID=A0ABU5IVY2_9BACI|nr:MMPL family transporter [Bacillus sp. 31A1R]MDZ5471312.1 MMPL family transporter [Bacillus sp. 31A1R]